MTKLVAKDLLVKAGHSPDALSVLGDCVFKGGSLTGMIGPNGAGKTTFLKGLAGLIAPSKGSVYFDNVDITTMPSRLRARHIAYLPQGQMIQSRVVGRHLISLGRLAYGRSLNQINATDKTAIDYAIRVTEVGAFVDRPVSSLSGGERARVLLARALAVEADILLADEPLAALDPGYAMQMMEILRKEACQGRIVIVALHDLTLAARYCDKLILWNKGQIIADSDPESVLTEKHLATIYHIRAFIKKQDGHLLVTPFERVNF
ncbi:MAG: ABC transporter ATP-binding protein [Zymomonas mobilis subsp. pomaceae]|uniref:ABC transporter related protein n=1 Tax=Zymomonas mobilis subsp. pomaceae (strain ATCC 29192 / DSM 22645 / JCM 10191 / CCUG 17912 / NBRC 13757 / NCIMB 11200 / NRRL B-4491 / Barker I) TaxID=579138 RepID=F8ESR3_ZYMMT|nr:ABC transporter ATP-binding protein [Zymomonas mobilis]AEI37838.1 ABC transporter related protein [Zymomonas mobilis subsp. pomaceae ATCC 29192]MDX5949205.1 ABC transporter ATP-binding protein [Zymomonas mobilis subsp. pomaceae]GEB89567.1 ABC transporter [Zymomonas mobilis subsp. pomaceae]